MRKLVCVLLAAALFALCVPALAQVDLEALKQANLLCAIPDAYPSFVHRLFYYDIETGAVVDSFECYVSYDENLGIRYTYVMPNGDVQAWGRGEGYGYVGETQTPYVCGFVGGAYEERMLFHGAQNQGDFFAGQTIAAQETSTGGKLLLTLEGLIPEGLRGYEQFAGLTLVNHYTVDPETLIIEAGDTCIRGEDGVDRPYSTFTLEVDRTYTLPFDIALLKEPKALREVHVVANPGTEEEFDYVLEAPLNIPMAICAPDGYALYDDADCTVPAFSLEPDENGNYPATSTVYCVPASA